MSNNHTTGASAPKSTQPALLNGEALVNLHHCVYELRMVEGALSSILNAVEASTDHATLSALTLVMRPLSDAADEIEGELQRAENPHAHCEPRFPEFDEANPNALHVTQTFSNEELQCMKKAIDAPQPPIEPVPPKTRLVTEGENS